MNTNKFLYPTHSDRLIKAEPSECGKSVFLTNLTLKFINEKNKIYLYSPSLHQNLDEKLLKNLVLINLLT